MCRCMELGTRVDAVESAYDAAADAAEEKADYVVTLTTRYAIREVLLYSCPVRSTVYMP